MGLLAHRLLVGVGVCHRRSTPSYSLLALSHWVRHSFGLGEWDGEPIFLTHQLPPNPCVRIAWARAVILLVSVAISTCLLGVGLIKA